jgi:hypothetical protein
MHFKYSFSAFHLISQLECYFFEAPAIKIYCDMTKKATIFQTNIMNPLPKFFYLILTEINIFAYEVINVNRYHNFIPELFFFIF